MYLNRLINITITLLIILIFFVAIPVNADEVIENKVETVFNIELKSATDFKIIITMDVSRAVAFGTVYDGNEIRNLAVSTDPDDIEARGVIKGDLHDALRNQIDASFKNANFTALYDKPIYENYLFIEEYDVNLTSAFFGMNDTVNAHDFINGVLDMDAIISYSFNLQAEPGWNNIYIFDLGDSLHYDYVNTGSKSWNKAEWKVTNGIGNHPYTTAELRLNKTEPTTYGLESENISLEFELDSSNVKATSLATNVLIESADILAYNVLPNFIDNLQFMPADGFRLFVNNGLITWNDIYEKTVKPVEEKIKIVIEDSSFNQTMDLVISWDNTTTDCAIPYDIYNMDNVPLLRSILTDSNVDLKICNISNRAIFGLINAGAEANISEEDINFGENLNKIGYDYNVTLFLPEKMYLDGKNVYTWDENVSISGEFRSDNAVSYNSEKKDTVIEIEVESTDLNLLSFLTGKTELTLGMYLNENRNYNVTNVTELFSLPEKIVLSYLNSDAFRLCVEEDVFSKDDVSDFLKNEKKLFEDRLMTILSNLDVRGKGQLNRDVFDKSLKTWDGDISEMDADTSIKINSYAHCSHQVSFDLAFLPPRFDIPRQSFNFTGISGHNVTYRMIFPEGMSLEVNDPLNKAKVKTIDDGRKCLEISFNESEYNLTDIVSCKITLSALFITGMFMPCIISIIITIILFIVIYIVRRKRKRVRGKVVAEEDSSGYENEDYYVPPPPGSK